MRYLKIGFCVCFLGLIAVRSAAAADDPVVKFQRNAIGAYNSAIKQQQPLIVVFLCPEGRSGCKHCVKVRRDLASAAMRPIADKAVFVIVEIGAKGSSPDRAGATLYRRLGIKARPSISLLEPNTKKIVEISRLNGYFKPVELVEHLQKAIARYDARNQVKK